MIFSPSTRSLVLKKLATCSGVMLLVFSISSAKLPCSSALVARAYSPTSVAGAEALRFFSLNFQLSGALLNSASGS
jgi:hypothetical protein